eukprot:Skav201898  [mRNA]  locus=scaffold550:973648:974946:- [translate_table: standard]
MQRSVANPSRFHGAIFKLAPSTTCAALALAEPGATFRPCDIPEPHPAESQCDESEESGTCGKKVWASYEPRNVAGQFATTKLDVDLEFYNSGDCATATGRTDFFNGNFAGGIWALSMQASRDFVIQSPGQKGNSNLPPKVAAEDAKDSR